MELLSRFLVEGSQEPSSAAMESRQVNNPRRRGVYFGGCSLRSNRRATKASKSDFAWRVVNFPCVDEKNWLRSIPVDVSYSSAWTTISSKSRSFTARASNDFLSSYSCKRVTISAAPVSLKPPSAFEIVSVASASLLAFSSRGTPSAGAMSPIRACERNYYFIGPRDNHNRRTSAISCTTASLIIFPVSNSGSPL